MPAITLDKPAILTLKTSRIFTTADYCYLALRFDKDPANSTQTIDADLFATDWDISNSELFRFLQQLETKKQIKIQPTNMTLNWSQNETTNMTQQEVLDMKSEGLINSTTYAYYALLLSKGAGLVQTVNPSTYQAAPWKIEPATLLNEISAIAAKQNADKTPVFKLDLTTIQIIWLV
jgi:hypothetical protein